jgi:hypothetical protein
MQDLSGPSRSTQEHRFFEKHLDNDLDSLSAMLHDRYNKINSGELFDGEVNTNGTFSDSKSLSTMNWSKYNAFQFYDVNIHKLFKAVKEMTVEACDYYGINFDSQHYMVQGWFNINHAKAGKLNWHDHGGAGAPAYHGYYCVSAQPSITNYRLFDQQEVENVNKNNRAILSETGHPHAMGDWDWEGPRITIAYDVFPMRYIDKVWQEQHWIPLV